MTLRAAPADPDTRGGADPRRWRILVVSQLCGFMSLLDVSIVNVALPSMQRGLHATAGEIQWAVSGYALTFGLALVPAGRLGDALGRRRMFLVALSAFIATSVLAGAAPTAVLLVAARLAQGLAGGMLTPQNSGLIQDLFRGAERGRAFGVFGATVGMSTAVGPVVGGLILALFDGPGGWRFVFFVNVPIGLVALVAAARLLPRERAGGPVLARLDFAGAGLLCAAVLAVLLPLVTVESGGLRRLWWLFPTAVLLFAAFARWELWLSRRGRAPLLEPRLLTGTAGYPAGAAVGTAYFIGFSGVFLVFALFFQYGLGYSPLRSGLSVTSFAVGSAVAAGYGGRLVARLDRRLTVIGLVLTAVGLAAAALVLARVGGTGAGLAAALPLAVAGVGCGFVISPNITLSLQEVPVSMAGAAGGALQTGARIGSAIGTAALASIFYGVLSGGHGFPAAIAWSLAGAVGFVLLALAVAVADLRRRRPRGAAAPLADGAAKNGSIW